VFEQPATILEAIFAGADGYLLKKARAPELLSALQAVSAGGGMLTPEVARRVLDLVRETRAGGATARHTAPARLDLTDREQQVLRGLVDGLSYKQVAAALASAWGPFVRTSPRSTEAPGPQRRRSGEPRRAPASRLGHSAAAPRAGAGARLPCCRRGRPRG